MYLLNTIRCMHIPTCISRIQLRQDLLDISYKYSANILHSLAYSLSWCIPYQVTWAAPSIPCYDSVVLALRHQQAGRLGTTTTQSATSLPSSSPFGYIKTIFRLLPKNLNILKIINCGWVTKCLPASRWAARVVDWDDGTMEWGSILCGISRIVSIGIANTNRQHSQQPQRRPQRANNVAGLRWRGGGEWGP